MTWKIDAPQGNETAKTRWRAVPYTRGKGLDLGCGPQKLYPTKNVVGIDNDKDLSLFGIASNMDVKQDVTDLSLFQAGVVDFVFSSHVLEHIEPEKVTAALREWMRVVKVGGHLVLYLPASGLYPDPGQPGANPDHKWAVTYAAVIDYMKRCSYGWDLIEYELCDQNDEYSHFFAFKKLKNPNQHREAQHINNPDKLPTVGIVRYGAFGDTIQAASICAAYRAKGYHVTLFCTYPASEVVALDPNIDRLIVQLGDQIPMEWLGHLWVWWRPKFDKWVNLTESVEVNLLAVEGNIRFEWNAASRHEAMNVNYLEFQHKLAGVADAKPVSRFYPSDDEKQWAQEELKRMKKAGIHKFILWGLAGSSRTHKIWPHIDPIFERVLGHYGKVGWGIVPVGDGSCAELIKGWEGERRIWKTCGQWTARQAFTMVEHAAVVVGPETGLMSIAAMYPMPKIVFLSHSTVENLTRDWVNTTSLYAPDTHCPGRGKNEAPACHLMIPKFEPGCRRHVEFGTAQCVAEIQPAWCWEVLQKAMVEGSGGLWQPPQLAIQL